MKPVLMFFLLLTIILSLNLFAQIPRTLSYQGVLTDSLGNPKSDGVYSFTFRLYDVSTAGSSLWLETKDLQVKRGLFSTTLGDVTPFGSSITFTKQYWLSIKAGADPEMPQRIPLNAVGYSLNSVKADTAQYAKSSPQQAFVDSARIVGTISDNSVTSSKIVDGTIQFTDIAQNGASTGQVMKWNGLSWTPRNDSVGTLGVSSQWTTSGSNIYYNTGNVGIGTATPVQKLDVRGNINIMADRGYMIDSVKILSNPWDNVFVGAYAGFSNVSGSGYANTANGFQALYSNTTGWMNTAVGMKALFSNTVGYYNSAIGRDALFSNTIGAYNAATGKQALYANTTGSYNTATGVEALLSNTTGVSNTATGSRALYSNTTAANNTANGVNALYSNTTGQENTANGTNALRSNTTGNSNTATGGGTLYFNSTGNNNTATGMLALSSNTTGEYNTANGVSALRFNTEGASNTANGVQSLFTNTTGIQNTANGVNALFFNTTGNNNTANGVYALYSNTTGNNNTGIGRSALIYTTTGFQNTTVGANSLVSNTTGSYNTAIGYNTGPNSANLFNTTCIGIDATATASNMVRIGNVFVTSIGGQVGWSTLSDGRFKENVNENVPGLDFITKLRPVTYQVNREMVNELTGVHERRSKIAADNNTNEPSMASSQPAEIVTGFIAQEVETAAQQVGYNFSGVDKPQDENGYYGLRYAEFTVPLVKAVQEQQKLIEELLKRIEALENK